MPTSVRGAPLFRMRRAAKPPVHDLKELTHGVSLPRGARLQREIPNERSYDMRLSIAKLGLPLLLVAAGCTTMGAGTGSTPSGTDKVTFSWKSSDSVSGAMSASLSDG